MSSVKRILVTGATGYIGQHLVAHLLAQGHQIIAVKKIASATELSPQITSSRQCKILDYDGEIESLLQGIAKFGGADLAIHLATLFISKHKPSDIKHLCESNFSLAVQVLEACAQTNINKVINIGTLWEHDSSGGVSPLNLYAAIKHAAQEIFDYYVNNHNFSSITIKLLDTYGGNDSRNKLLPLLKRASRTGETLPMTLGTQNICLTYIDDAVSAIVWAVQQIESLTPGSSHTYTIPGTETLTIKELVELLTQELKIPISVNWGALADTPSKRLTIWESGPKIPDWTPRVPLRTGLSTYFGEK